MALYERVKEFHEAFGQPVGENVEELTPERARLRLNLILEEVAEVVDVFASSSSSNTHLQAAHKSIKHAVAHLKNADDTELTGYDIVHLAKELSDVRVVVYGTDVELGIDADRVDNEVMDSNMSKLGLDGKPITNEIGKVMKGPNYKEADLSFVTSE